MKLVNVVRKDGTPFRMLDIEAQDLVATGNFQYTSKGAVKAFYKRLARSVANQEYIAKFDMSKKQSSNFVTEENGKIVANILLKQKPFTYKLPEDPEDKEKVAKHKSWIESIVEAACINPNDHTIKQGILSKIAIFFGFLSEFMKAPKEVKTHETIMLPQYHRRVIGYGTLKTPRDA